jgi:hypothetical protein
MLRDKGEKPVRAGPASEVGGEIQRKQFTHN